MAELGDALLTALGLLITGAFCAYFALAAALIAWLVFESERHNARLSRRGLPLPPRQPRSAGEWWSGVLALMFVGLMATAATAANRPPLPILMIMASMAVLLCAVGWIGLFARIESDLPETMAYFDFFSHLSPKALAEARGPLAVPAVALHHNIERLRGEFTVITTGGQDRDRFPSGQDRLGPRYVALVANRAPVGLFFHRGALYPLDRALYVEELHYKLVRGSDPWRRPYVFPEPLGAVDTRRGWVRRRLPPRRRTEAEVQQLIDAFVERRSSPGPDLVARPFSATGPPPPR